MLFVILAFALRAGGAEPATASPKGVVTQATSLPGEPPYGLQEGRHRPKSAQVCFRDPISGSKIPTRRCMSREAFLQRQQESKDHLDAIQRDARVQMGF
ncbi:MAG: hypothetical protein KKE02_17650 [Alphaproteobacteria bacterium]|nr:hypothetical protein [Alphaproteobacteria bacterium]MBU1513312.1 hypothetical protein [Alphaproteobacteria bacterium]MBU2096304.1 hypothetical protein [Alphaproteobacteria bacterium]MBU2152848.1 hypothetical protein [Alphaproteobacteria bacterium]MBU2306188.1 hypothetical protein [Alphaproteobacteria bacterium]